MSTIVYIVAILCVFGIAAGQILFKLGAASYGRTKSFFDPNTALTFILAFALYGLMTLVWVWVLQKAELGRVYPLMALAFVLVPWGSYLVFGERFQPQYFVGIAIIMAGILISVRS